MSYKLPNFQQKFDEAIKVYFACKDPAIKETISYLLTAHLTTMQSVEIGLDDILNNNTKRMTIVYNHAQKALREQMIAYLTKLE